MVIQNVSSESQDLLFRWAKSWNTWVNCNLPWRHILAKLSRPGFFIFVASDSFETFSIEIYRSKTGVGADISRGSTTVTQCLPGLPASTLKPLQRLINACSTLCGWSLGPYDECNEHIERTALAADQISVFNIQHCVLWCIQQSLALHLRNTLRTCSLLWLICLGSGRLRSAASGSFDVPRVNSYRLSSILCRWTSSVEQFTRGNEECTDDTRYLQEQTELHCLFEQAYPAIGQWGCSY